MELRTAELRTLRDRFPHSTDSLNHAVFGVTERYSQETLSFLAEGNARDSDDLVLQAFLGDLEIVPEWADIKHCVKSAFRRRGGQAKLVPEKLHEKFAAFPVNVTRVLFCGLGFVRPGE